MVEVWQLDINHKSAPSYIKAISPEDRIELNRVVCERTRALRMIGRGYLRTLLSNRIGIPVSKIDIKGGDRGKPKLINEEVEFNLANSGTRICIAISSEGAVGVDIEKCNPSVVKALAGFIVAPEEDQILDAVDFFRRWVVKEACLKCFGVGLSLPMARCTIGKEDERGWKRCTTTGYPDIWVRAVFEETPYFAAVALETHQEVRVFSTI